MASIVGSKGQIVISKPIREALGVKPGYTAVQKLTEGHLEVHFYPPDHSESLRGALAHATTVSVPAETWDEVRDAAWAEAANPKSGFDRMAP